MVRFNDCIYEEEREAPVIKFENGKRYSFDTPRDGGTGTAYKSLVVLDMSILELTDLSAIAHDSSIFKNIGDEPIDKIMELYMKSKKQVFIAFDKEQAYLQRTGEILFSLYPIYNLCCVPKRGTFTACKNLLHSSISLP